MTPTGIGFFSVWMFYADCQPLVIEERLYHCVVEIGFQHERQSTMGQRLSRIRRLALAFVIVEALVSDPLDPTRLDHLLVFIGKANLDASSQAQVTRGGFFQLFAGPLHEVQRSWFG